MLPKVQVSNNSNTHIHVWLLSCNKCIIKYMNIKKLKSVYQLFIKIILLIFCSKLDVPLNFTYVFISQIIEKFKRIHSLP